MVENGSLDSDYLPFTALFADSPRKMGSDLTPGLGTVLLDTLHEDTILFFSPRALYHLWVEHLLPPMETLNVCAVFELFCNFLPVFGLDKIDQTG